MQKPQELIDQLSNDPRPLGERGTEALAFELAEAVLTYIDAAVATEDVAGLKRLHRNLWETFASWLRPDGPAVNFIDMSEYVSLVLDALLVGANPTDDDFLAEYRAGLSGDLATSRAMWAGRARSG